MVLVGGRAGVCVCPEITEDTYQGSNWPSLLPERGCGDCGLPEPPGQFFLQLIIIIFPAIIILLFYGLILGVKKLMSK